MSDTCSNVFDEANPRIHCHSLGRIESVWLYTTSLSGIISTIAVLAVFAYVFRNARRYRVQSGRWPDLKGKPMDVYLLSLFFADLLHALADLFSLKWVNEGNVYIGSICTAQSILTILGANSIAASTLAITVHTFAVVWFKKGTSSGLLAIFIVAGIWAYIVLFNIVLIATHQNLSDVYAPTPSWCGIANNHLGYKIISEYLWLWLALLVSFAVYIPLSFFVRRHITHSNEKWAEGEKVEPRLFYTMIVYPVIYSAIVLPISVVRWLQLTHKTTNLAVVLSTKSLLGLSGVLDVLVFLVTRRRDVLSFNDPNPDGQAPALFPLEAPTEIQMDEGTNVGNRREHESAESYGRLPDVVEGG